MKDPELHAIILRYPMPAVRTRSKVKILEKCLGGKWTYDGFCSWYSDDGKHVSRCSAGVDEWDNEIGPAQYFLYDGETSRRVWWNRNGMTLM